jgi:predicted dithiol-disulfide oxidoreductase (DUF899 family)
MYNPASEKHAGPCDGCTIWCDGFNAYINQLERRGTSRRSPRRSTQHFAPFSETDRPPSSPLVPVSLWLCVAANFVVIAKGSWEKLNEYARRRGYRFRFLSSAHSDFNKAMGVESTADQQAGRAPPSYNFGGGHMSSDAAGKPVQHISEQGQGLSAFYRDPATGAIYLTYATHCRGVDIVNAGNQLMDMLPFGRAGYDGVM